MCVRHERINVWERDFWEMQQFYICSLQFLQIAHTEMKHKRTRAEHIDSWHCQQLRC